MIAVTVQLTSKMLVVRNSVGDTHGIACLRALVEPNAMNNVGKCGSL